MRILVTGAKGFVGRWLVERLSQEGHSVRALARGGPASGVIQVGSGAAPGVETFDGDLMDPPTLERASRGVEVIFHLAGIRRASTRSDFFRVNAEGTERVFQAALAHGVRRVVLASSLAAVGPSTPEQPHVEEDPLQPTEWYGESKAEAERIALSHARALEVAVARPPRIIGPADRENLVFFKLVQRGVALHFKGPSRPLTVVDIDDVLDLLLLLGTRPEAVGESFFIAGFQTSMEEIQALGAAALGLSPRTVQLPPWLLTAAATALDGISKLTGTPLPLNRKLARQLLAPAWTCSSAKAERLLGFRARRSLKESIGKSVAWYRAQGWL